MLQELRVGLAAVSFPALGIEFSINYSGPRPTGQQRSQLAQTFAMNQALTVEQIGHSGGHGRAAKGGRLVAGRQFRKRMGQRERQLTMQDLLIQWVKGERRMLHGWRLAIGGDQQSTEQLPPHPLVDSDGQPRQRQTPREALQSVSRGNGPA